MENLTKLSREEDGSDAQEWKEITVEEEETSESLSLNLVNKKTEFCFRSLDKKKDPSYHAYFFSVGRNSWNSYQV